MDTKKLHILFHENMESKVPILLVTGITTEEEAREYLLHNSSFIKYFIIDNFGILLSYGIETELYTYRLQSTESTYRMKVGSTTLYTNKFPDYENLINIKLLHSSLCDNPNSASTYINFSALVTYALYTVFNIELLPFHSEYFSILLQNGFYTQFHLTENMKSKVNKLMDSYITEHIEITDKIQPSKLLYKI